GEFPGPEIDVDPWQIEQVLTNLLRNAAQANPGGDVRLSWGAENGTRYFVVEDDGPGVPAGDRHRVFEPFFTTNAVGDGSGMGLAVAGGIVKQHGGSIKLDEAPGGGARFRVLLGRPHAKSDSPRSSGVAG